MLLALVGVATALTGVPAEAAKRCEGSVCAAPSCSDPTVPARDGIARSYTVSCRHTRGVELLRGPEAGRLERLSANGGGVAFDFTPAAGNEADQSFEARLTGNDGSTKDVTFRIDVIPRADNTPPRCSPVSTSQRVTDPGPVRVEFSVSCSDAEDDPMMLHGGGPGRHPGAPRPLTWNGGYLWTYEPVTRDGVEQTSYWATDVLGATSAPAAVTIELGPGVDRPTTCLPNPYYGGYGLPSVLTRPGRIRRFGVYCEDPDGDAFSVAMGEQPARGLMTLNDTGTLQPGWWGVERFVDATFVPADDGDLAEQFALLTDTGGRRATHRMQMLTVAEDRNHGYGCGYSDATTPPGTPGTVELWCTDAEGDPLDVELVTPPAHGIAGPPVSLPAQYGQERITIPYTPEPGFECTDCVVVKVGDMPISIDIHVRVPEPPMPPPPPFGEPWIPSGPPAPAFVPPPWVRNVATSGALRVPPGRGVKVTTASGAGAPVAPAPTLS